MSEKSNAIKVRNKRRRRRRALIRAIFRCALMVAGLCLTIALLTKLLNGDYNLAGSVESAKNEKVVKKQAAPQEVKMSKEELARLPESLQRMYEKNKDAREFVSKYEEKHGVKGEIDVSDDVKKGEIPLFLQWDDRWGYLDYGAECMGITGCGPTALSMVYCGLTGDTSKDPYTLAQQAYDEGFYVEGTGTSWDIMTSFARELGLDSRELSRDEAEIVGELLNGHPVICIMGPGDFTDQGHFIVLTGINEDGLITVNDPNSISNSRKAWPLSTIMSQMKNLWALQL